jgi:hypothetical protein
LDHQPLFERLDAISFPAFLPALRVDREFLRASRPTKIANGRMDLIADLTPRLRFAETSARYKRFDVDDPDASGPP